MDGVDMWNPEKMLEESREQFKKHEDYVNIKEMAALEDELIRLKEERGIAQKRGLVFGCIDRLLADAKKKKVVRKTYLRLALALGWFCGAHRFYAGQKIRGLLYLLFFWTGIPFAMTVVDLMIALPMKPDENGEIWI